MTGTNNRGVNECVFVLPIIIRICLRIQGMTRIVIERGSALQIFKKGRYYVELWSH